MLFAILQKYDFSSKSQPNGYSSASAFLLFAILQKYDFSSKSQHIHYIEVANQSCLRYCKSTIFQANHNTCEPYYWHSRVVCDTAKVRFFKQITTEMINRNGTQKLFAILQKYDFSSKSQLLRTSILFTASCLRYCKSTIFQANHNSQAK